jgi:hypothetical protein
MSSTLQATNIVTSASAVINSNTLKSSLVTQNNNTKTNNEDFINTRLVQRIKLQLTLFIRRPINSVLYFQQVTTLDVSRYGALISSKLPLQIGDELEVTRPITNFKATAYVRHITHDKTNNRYLIGLDFQTVSGKWIVI